jgi:hypothetical protein
VKSVRVLYAVSLALVLTGCAGYGAGGGQQVAPAMVTPDFGFGCPPHGHLNGVGGAIKVSAAPLRISIGYATNPSTLCPTSLSASTSNTYGAPRAPRGSKTLLYVELTIESHPTTAQWGTTGPQEYVRVADKDVFKAGDYCLAWYVSSGSGSQKKWTKTWQSAAAQSNGGKSLRLTGASPYYTPFFDGTVIEFVETVFELRQASQNVKC